MAAAGAGGVGVVLSEGCHAGTGDGGTAEAGVSLAGAGRLDAAETAVSLGRVGEGRALLAGRSGERTAGPTVGRGSR